MTVTESHRQRRASAPSISLEAVEWLTVNLQRRLPEIMRRHRYRADLRRLLRIGPHMFNDIGLTLEAARREAEKPFW